MKPAFLVQETLHAYSSLSIPEMATAVLAVDQMPQYVSGIPSNLRSSRRAVVRRFRIRARGVKVAYRSANAGHGAMRPGVSSAAGTRTPVPCSPCFVR